MQRNIVETVVGGLVLVVAVGFLVQLVSAADVFGTGGGYRVEARFLRAGGLRTGAEIQISGVKVGRVVEHRLDRDTFEAVTTLVIDADIQLPVDTQAVVAAEGLLGGFFLRLVPGRSEEMLTDGGELTNTEDYRALEDQVSDIIFLAISP